MRFVSWTAWRVVVVAGTGIMLTVGCSTQETRAPETNAVVYSGAGIVSGDGSPVIENGALVVEDGTIVAVDGGETVEVPAGARTVDLSGRTIMPILINTHGHPGFQRGLTYTADNYTRETIVDDLHRALYFGVGVVQSQGIERGEETYEIRADQKAGELGGATLLIAGRGIGAPNAGPGHMAYQGIAYEVTTPSEGVAAVEELAAKDVDAVKIWVDDRNGRAPRMEEAVFAAIIDEAHRHGLQVTAHVYYHTDAEALVRAGVDGFAHLVRDREMDDALVASIVEHDVYVMGNLSNPRRRTYDERPSWLQEGAPMMTLLSESVPPAVIERMVDAYSETDPETVALNREAYGILSRSLAKLNAAGARLILGADTGIEDHLFGLASHRELEEMVRAGMSPQEAIVAATSRGAEFLGLERLGSLTVGKAASFIVLDASPLDDITNTGRIRDVYIEGERVDRAAIRSRLASSATPLP